MPDPSKPDDHVKTSVKDGALAPDQLDKVSGGLNIGSQGGGSGAGKLAFDDESPKEEIS